MDKAALDLSGKCALVTGAGSGIGRAIALELARCGAFVAVNYHANRQGALETLEMIGAAGGRGQVVEADVTVAAEVAAMLDLVGRHSGRLDILVNNAGTLVRRSKVRDMTEELWDAVMGVNLKSAFLCCRAALPLMGGWGRIVNMSSQAAHDGGGNGASHYAAAKAAVIAFTKGLAKELAPEGITVNCVAPGIVTTAFHDVFSTPDSRAAMVKGTPLGREGRVEDVASAVLFLASDLASHITGETINVNGGARMC